MGDDLGEAEILSMDSGRAAHPPVAPGVAASSVAPPGRVLVAKSSRERSPRRSFNATCSSSPSLSSSAAAAGVVFAVDVAVLLTGLTARPELNGSPVTVLSFDTASGRYAIRLASGEDIRVRSINVQKSIFG